jgi:hypothetical protein
MPAGDECVMRRSGIIVSPVLAGVESEVLTASIAGGQRLTDAETFTQPCQRPAPRLEHVVEVDPVDQRSAERWARAMYESPPAVERLFVWYGWKALTARLGPYPSRDHVLGYRIEASEQNYIRFSVEWALGLACDLVLYTGPSTAGARLIRAARATRRQVRMAGRRPDPRAHRVPLALPGGPGRRVAAAGSLSGVH